MMIAQTTKTPAIMKCPSPQAISVAAPNQMLAPVVTASDRSHPAAPEPPTNQNRERRKPQSADCFQKIGRAVRFGYKLGRHRQSGHAATWASAAAISLAGSAGTAWAQVTSLCLQRFPWNVLIVLRFCGQRLPQLVQARCCSSNHPTTRSRRLLHPKY
jgi:hypothetical protein